MLDDITVDWMLRRHVADVLAIEQASFEFPWSEEDFATVMAEGNALAFVAEHAGRAVGFAIARLEADYYYLLNVAVAPEFRRLGIGRRLVDKFSDRLSPVRRNRISLEVRESNLSAHLWLRAIGFHAVCVLAHWYDNSENAYRFVLRCKPGAIACDNEPETDQAA